MVPYQIYQALMDQHDHELQAASRRHGRVAEARRAATSRTEGSSRIKDALGHLVAMARVSGRTEVRRSAGSTTAGSATTGSAAGPMGCVA
jgi:hypothetical protein